MSRYTIGQLAIANGANMETSVTIIGAKELLSLLAPPMSYNKTREIAAANLNFVAQRIQQLQDLRNEFLRLLADTQMSRAAR